MQEIVSRYLNRWDLPDWGWNLVLVGASIFIGLLMLLVLALFTRKQVEEVPRYSLFRSLLTHLGKPMAVFLPLFCFNILLPAMKAERLLVHKIGKAVEISMIIVFAWLLVKCISVVRDWVLHRYDINRPDNFHARKVMTQLQYVRRIALFIITLVTIALVLLSFENMRTLGSGLLTGVGLGGIIIGFAAQRSLANFLAGFQIAFTQPFRIDDVLVVENEFGRVDEITLTYVVLRLWDERRLVLPITYFTEKPFQNWTRINTNLLGGVEFFADYTLPVDKVRAKFESLVQDSHLWDGKVKNLQVTGADNRTIQVRALVSASNSGALWDLRCHIREKLIAYVNEAFPESLPRLRTVVESHNGLDKIKRDDLPFTANAGDRN